MRPEDSSILEELLSAPDYRAFFTRLYLHRKSVNPALSYATFAKKAGFASKSYFSDILAGRKRMTSGAFEGVSHVLRLKGDLKRLAFLRVAREEPDFSPLTQDGRNLDAQILRVSARLRRGKPSMSEGTAYRSIYRSRNWPEIYCALGTPEEGSALEEVADRTGLAHSFCQSELAKMAELGVVRTDARARRYYPLSLHLVFNLIGKDAFFKKFFLDTLGTLRKEATRKFDHDRNFYFVSAFSVSPERMPDLKEKLREATLKFVDHAEDPTGGKIARLTIGMFAPE